MSENEIPGVARAFLLLKRELHKVAKSAKNPVVVIPAEALPKVAKAIDPSGRQYPDVTEHSEFMHFFGVSIVAAEAGEAGIRAAAEKQRQFLGESGSVQ